MTWVDDDVIAFTGDMIGGFVTGAWSVDVTVQNPEQNNIPLVPESSLSLGAEVFNDLEIDSLGRVYFMSTHQTGTQLFRANADGTNLEKVPGTAIVVNGEEVSIITWGLSSDGTQLAFGVAPHTGNSIGQIYTVDILQTATATAVTDFAVDPVLPNISATCCRHIRWNADDTAIVFVGDYLSSSGEEDDRHAVFYASVNDTSAIRLALPASGDDFTDARFSSDGTVVFALPGSLNATDRNVIATSDLSTADQTGLDITSTPPGGHTIMLRTTP